MFYVLITHPLERTAILRDRRDRPKPFSTKNRALRAAGRIVAHNEKGTLAGALHKTELPKEFRDELDSPK